MGTGVDFISFVFLAAATVTIYFAPMFVAFARSHRNAMGVSLVNIFLGWSLIGWVAAMVWACLNSNPVAEDRFGQLGKLAKLRDDGSITTEEYEEQKRKLLQ
ncbi:Superinfection immunity protein [compost metagenome]